MLKKSFGSLAVFFFGTAFCLAQAPPQPANLGAAPAGVAPLPPPVVNPADGQSATSPITAPLWGMCKSQPVIWASSDYLFWWSKNAPAPVPLVTTGSLADPIPGALGQPGTKVLFGDQTLDA